MTAIKSKLIIGAAPAPETEQALRVGSGLAADVEVSMQVFEVEVDNTIRYACIAGGTLLADPAGIGGIMPSLTLAGQGACEAMMRLPYLYDANGKFLYTLVFHGVALGKTPLADKVLSAFRYTADTRALICFVGDLAKELDGKMQPALNVCDAVAIGDIAGMRRPGE